MFYCIVIVKEILHGVGFRNILVIDSWN